MNETMSSKQFTNLVEGVVEEARDSRLLSEELYQEVLEQILPARVKENNESIAWAVRQLSPFCDWREFGWANDHLGAGGQLDDLHLEIQRVNDKRKAMRYGQEYHRTVASLAHGVVQYYKDQRRFFQMMRDAETLMGFDQEFTNKLVATLGPWDELAVPNSLIDLLPEELTFPLRKTHRATPYDHRVHLLVRLLVSRLGTECVSDEVVIRHCGHVLAELLHADDDEAASRLVLGQVTLLAEEFVGRHPWDVLGLCWRGELACWAWDEELAEDYANRVWDRTVKLTAKEVSKVTSFFTLTTDWSEAWSSWGWDCFDSPRSHLGEIKLTRIGLERPLALAVVRSAFQRGVWDTSLLSSTLELQDNFYILEPDDLPVECWVWMAENIEHSRHGNEFYYTYWYAAFKSLASDTDPRLAHNILVVLLAGLLFNKCERYETPSIQQVLSNLTDIYRANSTTHKKQAALDMVRYVYVKMNPDYLTAADRLAITKAIEDASRPPTGVSLVESSPKGSTSEQIDPSLLNQAEVYLKTQISETTWARLTPKAKNEFKHGEFLYIMATKLEGEGGNFDSFVLHYSKGLLAEIQESLRAPLLKDQSLKGPFLAVFGDQERPEWPQLLRFISDLENVAGTALGKRLLSQGVAFPRLRELRDFFEKLKALRNRAAHSGSRINRDEATLLHGLLLNKGIIQSILECFPKPPKR